jgi:hypothetical protein
MNPEATEYLNKILQKNPSALSETEKVFLRARRGYLKDVQIEEYKEVLDAKHVVEKAKPVENHDEEMVEAYKKEAKGLGLKFAKDITKDELISMIKSKKASNRVQIDTKE